MYFHHLKPFITVKDLQQVQLKEINLSPNNFQLKTQKRNDGVVLFCGKMNWNPPHTLLSPHSPHILHKAPDINSIRVYKLIPEGLLVFLPPLCRDQDRKIKFFFPTTKTRNECRFIKIWIFSMIFQLQMDFLCKICPKLTESWNDKPPLIAKI